MTRERLLLKLFLLTSACRAARPEELMAPAAPPPAPETSQPAAEPVEVAEAVEVAEPGEGAPEASAPAPSRPSLSDLLARTHLFGVALILDESRGPDGAAVVARCRAEKFPKKLAASEELGPVTVGRPVTLIHERGAFQVPVSAVKCHRSDDFNDDRAVVEVNLRGLPAAVRRDFSSSSRAFVDRLVVLGEPPDPGARLALPPKIPASERPPLATRWKPKERCGAPFRGRDAWWLDESRAHAYVVTRQACEEDYWLIGAFIAASAEEPALVVGEADTNLNKPLWLVDLDGDGTQEVVLNHSSPGFNEFELAYREGDAWKLHKLLVATYD